MGPSNKNLSYVIENNTIGYNTLRRKDVWITKGIFWLSESVLKAKIVQKKSKMIRDEEIELPEQLTEKFKFITLYIDIVHVNGIAFLVRKNAHIGHHIATPIIHKDAEHFVKAIDEMQTKHATRGGIVKHIIGDGAFK